MTWYSERLRDALRCAEAAHRGQSRKGGDVPYVLHPIAVAGLLMAAGAAEDLVCAGLLHDVVEDSATTTDELRERFGPQVAALVDAVSELKELPDGSPNPWDDRKRAAIAHLAEAEPDVVALKAADLAVNLGDIVHDHAQVGDELWQRFNAGATAQIWYYRSVAEIVLERGTLALLEQEVRDRVAVLERITASSAAAPAPGPQA